MIRLEGYMEIRQLEREGKSISAIARETGYDRKTVRKYLTEGWKEPTPRPRRGSKLDPFKEYLLGRMLTDGVWNTSVLLDEIQERGYGGGWSTLRGWVQSHRERERQLEVFRRVITEPGRQFQVDWGHFPFRGRTVYGFAAVLSCHRFRFLRFFPRQDLEHFIEGHLLLFDRIGFVPWEGLYDNLKSVILRRIQREKVLNPRFQSFACQMGFYPRVCLPYSPASKGKVENLVGYAKGNFWVRYADSCSDIDELNRAADEWLVRVNGKVHGTTGQVPAEMLAEERAKGIPWEDVRPYNNVYRCRRQSFKDATISYSGVRYSVPYLYARQSLEVQEPLARDEIRIYSGTELIAVHRRPDGPERLVVDPAHYRGMPLKARISRPAPIEEGLLLPAGPGIGCDRRAPLVQERSLVVYDHAGEVTP